MRTCEANLSGGRCPSRATHGRRCWEHRPSPSYRLWLWAIEGDRYLMPRRWWRLWEERPRQNFWASLRGMPGRVLRRAIAWAGRPLTIRAALLVGPSGGVCGYPRCDALAWRHGACREHAAWHRRYFLDNWRARGSRRSLAVKKWLYLA